MLYEETKSVGNLHKVWFLLSSFMPALMKPINASSTSNSTARQSGKLIKLNKNNNDGKAYPIGVCTCFGLCAKCHCAVYVSFIPTWAA